MLAMNIEEVSFEWFGYENERVVNKSCLYILVFYWGMNDAKYKKLELWRWHMRHVYQQHISTYA